MILSYVYDFISFVFEKDMKKDIRRIVLFGSTASGEHDEESDVDIFIDIWDEKHKNRIEKTIRSELGKFEDKASRLWHPRGVKNSISIIVGNLEGGRWQNLRHDMISNGIVLFGSFEKTPDNLKHMALISFSLRKIKQAAKMKIIRKLYGYSIKKGGKVYLQEGLLATAGGIKLAPNSVMVPIEKTKEFRKMLSRHNVTFEIREVWTY